jgi:hypothetical protein
LDKQFPEMARSASTQTVSPPSATLADEVCEATDLSPDSGMRPLPREVQASIDAFFDGSESFLAFDPSERRAA